MPVYVALVFCLMGSSAQQSCLEVYPDETTTLAGCAIRGQQLAVQWLENHPGYEFSHARCRFGEPFSHRQDI